ncbi:MAG: hypothetical protein HQL98_04475 [Magnetococcales bacterium]|nr:hypothetical protein [Magnetococcales bacterium]
MSDDRIQAGQDFFESKVLPIMDQLDEESIKGYQEFAFVTLKQFCPA